jgi:hypothetical protein
MNRTALIEPTVAERVVLFDGDWPRVLPAFRDR